MLQVRGHASGQIRPSMAIDIRQTPSHGRPAEDVRLSTVVVDGLWRVRGEVRPRAASVLVSAVWSAGW